MKRILLATVALGLSATTVMAAGPKADLNGDGQVTKDEFTTIASQNFSNGDLNGDNLLSKDEIKAMREARRDTRNDKRFDRVDANGDGAITRDEMEAAEDFKRDKRGERREKIKAKMLERFDTNVDGELSETEREVARAEMQTRRAERRGDRKNSPRMERPRPDANGDGFISRDEHMAVTEKLFARMDANGDGVLTKGEGKKRKGRKGKTRRLR